MSPPSRPFLAAPSSFRDALAHTAGPLSPPRSRPALPRKLALSTYSVKRVRAREGIDSSSACVRRSLRNFHRESAKLIRSAKIKARSRPAAFAFSHAPRLPLRVDICVPTLRQSRSPALITNPLVSGYVFPTLRRSRGTLGAPLIALHRRNRAGNTLPGGYGFGDDSGKKARRLGAVCVSYLSRLRTKYAVVRKTRSF